MGHDPCLAALPVESRNYFLAMYAISLIQGDTILGGAIRYRTLKHYITDAMTLFDALNLPIRNLQTIDHVKMVLDTVKKYESVPNRRNMITDSMMIWLQRKAASCNQDAEVFAMVDWIILGRYTGFRQSEWCQTKATSYSTKMDLPDNPAEAMLLADMVFLDKNERIINIKRRDFHESMVAYVQLRWRYQKNQDNGEVVTYARDLLNVDFCPVLAALRIALRAIRLDVPAHEPIAVHHEIGRGRRFITAANTAKLLREAAATVLGYKPTDPALNRWSTHSIRVTAANLLHRQRFSDSFIQKRLRWKSNTFLMYLRNTIYGAKQHALSLDISESNLPSADEHNQRPTEPHEELLLAAPAA